MFTVSETNYLSEKLGIDKKLDRRDFRNVVRAKMSDIFGHDNGVAEVNDIVNEFARSQVFRTINAWLLPDMRL